MLDFISPIIEKIAAGIRTTVNLAIDGINALIKAYNFANGLWGGADVALLNKLGENAASGTTSQFSRSSSKISNDFGSGGSMGSGSSGSSSAISAATSSIAGGSSAAVTNIAKLQKDVDMNLVAANKALDVANAAISRADAFFPISAGDLNYRDSFRSSPMNTYNLTVNGALNSEQTARQIITLLNDSQARGTQGATQLVTTTGAIGF